MSARRFRRFGPGWTSRGRTRWDVRLTWWAWPLRFGRTGRPTRIGHLHIVHLGPADVSWWTKRATR